MIELDLRDIQLPDGSVWWPPAAGWWLLLLALLAVVALAFWLLYQHRYSRRRGALLQLADIRDRLADGTEPKIIVDEISILLRRILISYYGRIQGASSTGDRWQQQLRELAPEEDFDQSQWAILSQQRYQRQLDCDLEPLLNQCERWIRALPRGPQRVSD